MDPGAGGKQPYGAAAGSRRGGGPPAGEETADGAWAPARKDGGLPPSAGVLAYRRSRLDLAEARLRAALAVSPRDPTARFDLAIVLRETSRPRPADSVLRLVASSAPGTPLAQRARRMLEGREPAPR